jgi:hypothetical protein
VSVRPDTDDSSYVLLGYDLENTTDRDYELSDFSNAKITTREPDGGRTEPIPDKISNLYHPVFVPAHQKGFIRIRLNLGSVPQRKPGENDDDSFRRVRDFAKTEIRDSGFSIYDPATRYQIELPRLEK